VKASILVVFQTAALVAVQPFKADAFQNLDFESGALYFPNPFEFPPPLYSDVLPGWTVRFGTNVQPAANCNAFILDYPAVSLVSTGGFFDSYVIDGTRSIYLQATDPSNAGGPNTIVSITQAGTIPLGANSLIFDARNQWHDSFPVEPGPFVLSLEGVSLALNIIASDGPDRTYAVDVSSWAGQTVELSIGVEPSSAWGGVIWEGWAVIDSIQFSPEVVPEPRSCAVLVTAGILICARRISLKARPKQ